ncbi:predicted protein [Botrytis cinerea T4]|uniref:Uncharacterized protein n=1 Tax=Botryotinia fuckeliana (strain T4) TaxID=999810 RepID=G2XSK8_BOTF4|nr:predicted protein [Botrytis cinerea T4]
MNGWNDDDLSAVANGTGTGTGTGTGAKLYPPRRKSKTP